MTAMQLPVRLSHSKPEGLATIPGELETSQERGKIDILRQSKNLKSPAEHFRVKQRLERPLRFLVGNDFRKARDESGQKMMLVGKTNQAHSTFLSRFGDVGPINVRGNVCFADLLERRIEFSMFRAHLDDFVKLGSLKSVVDREDKAARQFPGDVCDPIELRLVGCLFIRRLDQHEFVSGKIDNFVA